MKKLGFILLLVSLFLVGCTSPSKENSDPSATTDKSSIRQTSSAEKSSTQKSASTETNTSSTSNKVSEPNTSSTSSSTVETNISSSTIDTTSSQSSQSIDPLAGYSDLQIEYARVWLAIRGNTFRDTSSDFELHVIHYPAGTPIAPYDAGSAVYPKDVVMLTGKYSYQGVLVYSSNHDGTITSYPVPTHWQMPADQTSYPAFIRETTQEIIDNASVVAIPTGNPNDVKQLINVIVMDN
ncbi:hypothetical protein [Enterococcus faecium]|uniref:hypothetical protein n=1 Tax=Enterococcus faecium TaxID=1352 RepID=UPI0029314F3F|nr:hypothetical protein [Enterococcus faecium]